MRKREVNSLHVSSQWRAVNVSVPQEKHRFVVFADFFGVSTLTVADFKLPVLNWHTKFLKIKQSEPVGVVPYGGYLKAGVSKHYRFVFYL